MRNKKWILSLLIAILALPFFSGAVFAESDSEFEDGTYEIDYIVKHATEDKTSSADNFMSKPATLKVENGNKYIELQLTSSSMIKSLTVPSGEVDVISENKENDTRVVGFEVDGNLSEPVKIDMHVVVPGFYDTTHSARAFFNVSDVPIKTEEPVEDVNEPEMLDLADGYYTVDASYLKTDSDDASAMGRYLDDSIFLSVVNGKVQATITINENNTVTLLQLDSKNAVESVIDGDKRYETFEFDSIPALINAYVEYQAPYKGTVYNGKADFSISLNKESITKTDAYLKPGTNVNEDQTPDKDEDQEGNNEQQEEVEIELGSNVNAPVKSGDTITIKGDYGTTLILPENLPKGTELNIHSVQPKNHNGLTPAGKVYEFDFSDLGENPGDFILEMSYDTNKYSSDEVDIYYYDAEQGEWIAQNGEVENGKITITTNHFSTYGVFAQVEESEETEEPTQPEEPEDKEEPVVTDENNNKEQPNKSTTDLLTPDKAYKINYILKHATEDKESAAGQFFKEAVLLTKDGVNYLQVRITNADMIDALSNSYGEVVLVKENADGSMVVQFKVDNLSDVVKLDMHITVPGLYSMDHGVRLFLDESSMEEVDANKYQLVASDNENGPIVEGETGKKVGDDDLDDKSNGENKTTPVNSKDETPQKPEFGPSNNDSSNNNTESNGEKLNPQTGDTTNILLYVLLLVGSAIPLAIQFKRRFI